MKNHVKYHPLDDRDARRTGRTKILRTVAFFCRGGYGLLPVDGGRAWGKAMNTLCESEGCLKHPTFAPKGERAVRCAFHRRPGDESSGGRGTARGSQCEFEGCKRRPHFGIPGTKATRCGSHRVVGDRNLTSRQCEFEGCITRPHFGPPGGKAKRCGPHRKEGDQLLSTPRCEVEGCNKQPSFGPLGGKAKRCGAHKFEADANLKGKDRSERRKRSRAALEASSVTQSSSVVYHNSYDAVIDLGGMGEMGGIEGIGDVGLIGGVGGIGVEHALFRLDSDFEMQPQLDPRAQAENKPVPPIVPLDALPLPHPEVPMDPQILLFLSSLTRIG